MLIISQINIGSPLFVLGDDSKPYIFAIINMFWNKSSLTKIFICNEIDTLIFDVTLKNFMYV